MERCRRPGRGACDLMMCRRAPAAKLLERSGPSLHQHVSVARMEAPFSLAGLSVAPLCVVAFHLLFPPLTAQFHLYLHLASEGNVARRPALPRRRSSSMMPRPSPKPNLNPAVERPLYWSPTSARLYPDSVRT